MTQFELFDIENPCIGVCQSNAKGYCFGCLRRREERLWWHNMSRDQKRDVLRLVQARRKKLEKLAQENAVRTDGQMDFDFFNPEPLSLF